MVYDASISGTEWNTSERRDKQKLQLTVEGSTNCQQRKSFIASAYKFSETFGDYSLSKFKKSKAVLRNVKTEISITQNTLVIKLLYTVVFGGPESSVSIYWKIKETVWKHF